MARKLKLGFTGLVAFALLGCEATAVSGEAECRDAGGRWTGSQCEPSSGAEAGVDPVASLDIDPDFQPTDVVTDAADVFDPASEAALTKKLNAYNRTARHPIVVATVPDLGGWSAQDFSDRLANRWHVGQEDRGVFFLIAFQDRQMWMSVADGSLDLLPNERSQEIVDEILVPAYRRGEFYAGTDAATDAVISALS